MTVATLRQGFYPDVAARDPVARFLRAVEAAARPADRVLDLGAGTGELSAYALKGRVRQIVGVDLDRRVTQNRLLDTGLRADLYALPFQTSSFDLIFSVYVLEHVDRPAALAREIARVMRPGARCFVLTPNRYHYVPLISRLTPTVFHRWVNERRGRSGDDTFPTHYRLNSRRALARHFAAAGLDVVGIDAIEVQPNYLAFNPVAYACGIAYERVVNATELFSSLRVNLIAQFRKPVAA